MVNFVNFKTGYFIDVETLADILREEDPTICSLEENILLESITERNETICLCNKDVLKNFYREQLTSADYKKNIYIREAMRTATLIIKLIDEGRFPELFYVLM